MHWYGGSIAEAVTLSKKRNAIFVVFVEGDNDLSTEMAATIDDSAVVSRLSDEKKFLAVKLKSGTTNYTHFAQIYQIVPVPSLFFIGRNGTPLEVVCAGVQPDNLATRIDRILDVHNKEEPLPVQAPIQASTSSQDMKEQTAGLLHAEAVQHQGDKPDEKLEEAPPAKISKPSPEMEVVCDGDVCVRRPKLDQPSTSQVTPTATPPPTPIDENKQLQEEPSTASMEEKMERAKQLLEARRREKLDKEKELEKQKELERRSTGQGVAELKKWQADQELKQIQEERKREKLENNLARQRILEQIAQDRAERRARDATPAAAPSTAVPQPTTVQAVHTGDVSSEARVQFKLPDGSSHTANFNADDTLALVQRYVADNLHLSSSSFSLWTAFPRRELVESESSLRDLQLAPSSALLVLPRRVASQQPIDSTFSSVYTFIANLLTSLIYEPTMQLYTWLRTRLFPPPAVTPGGTRPTAGVPRPPPTSNLRRRTNIHRLPGDSGNDDDNNTWNGNSTQQM